LLQQRLYSRLSVCCSRGCIHGYQFCCS
jgi:hypothetical protein